MTEKKGKNLSCNGQICTEELSVHQSLLTRLKNDEEQWTLEDYSIDHAEGWREREREGYYLIAWVLARPKSRLPKKTRGNGIICW